MIAMTETPMPYSALAVVALWTSRSTARQPMPIAEMPMMHDLDQGGERFRLAVAEAMIVVRRHGGEAARRTE